MEDRGPTSIRLAERYRIGGLLGEGGMGEVRDCRDIVLGRDVALKLVKKEMREPAIEARFLREACVQAQLEHSSVVPVYDVGWDDGGGAFFTMRKVEGITLEDVIQAKRRRDPKITSSFTLHRLLGAFTKVCAAVDHAHARGVVHRDLKPANVMLGDYGEVYVLDWGLVKVLGDAPTSERGPALNLPDAQATNVGEALGTPAYVSPEQLAGQPLDARTDVFALGAILFEILTLETLFDAPAIEARLRGKATEWDARPSQRNRDVAPEFDRICARATAPDLKQRYASSRALHDAVEAWLAGDRDEDLRAALAGGHLARAESLAQTDPKAAMREVNRALVLAPNDSRAVALLVSLFQAATAAPSAEARAEAVSAGVERLRRTEPLGALLYGFAWVTLYPIFAVYRGVWNIWLAIAVPLAWVLASIALLVDWWQKSSDRVRYPTTMVMIAIAMTSAVFGPLLVVPALGVTAVANHILVSPTRHRRVQTLLACLAVVVPALLAWLGVLDTIRFESETTFALRGVYRTMRPWGATLAMTLADLTLLGATAFFASKFRDEIERARKASVLFVWQLGHLLPMPSKSESAGPDSARRPITDPLARADTVVDRSTQRLGASGFDTEIDGGGDGARHVFAGSRYQESDVTEEEEHALTVRARDRLVGRDVALSRAKDRSQSVEDDERFTREAFVLARLDHPGVPPLYDLGRDANGRAWFTTELVRGTPLSEARDRGRHRLLVAFAQVCLTIELAHARGIVHSALEPRSIILGDLDEVFVRSWQNANTHAVADASGAIALLPTRTTGARGYAAPEQAGGSRPDVRSDVFTLGAILFELLSGKPLFSADRTEVVLGRYDARPSTLAPESEPVPAELDAICVRATAYDPAERYASARELHDAVDAYLASDRDEALRASLAKKHLERATKSAERALAGSGLEDRVGALRELGPALALARDRGPALDLLERLLATPPAEPPPEVAKEVALQSWVAARRAAPAVAATFAIVWLVAFPIVGALLGVRDLAAAILVAAAWAVAAFVLWVEHSQARPSTLPWSGISGLVAVSATSLLFGPHIIVPGLAIAMTLSFILGGRLEWRRPLIALACFALLVPTALSFTGVLDVFRFERVPDDSAITMSGIIRGALHHPPDVLFLGLTLANLVAVLVAAGFAGRFRDVLEEIDAKNRAKVLALSNLVERSY